MDIPLQNTLATATPGEVLLVEENTVYCGNETVNVIEIKLEPSGLTWEQLPIIS